MASATLSNAPIANTSHTIQAIKTAKENHKVVAMTVAFTFMKQISQKRIPQEGNHYLLEAAPPSSPHTQLTHAPS